MGGYQQLLSDLRKETAVVTGTRGDGTQARTGAKIPHPEWRSRTDPRGDTWWRTVLQ
jgi:hypothetical protein